LAYDVAKNTWFKMHYKDCAYFWVWMHLVMKREE
jgi:hypothetical protein